MVESKEPIRWHTLTPEQRDELMVEKMLGYSLEHVRGSIQIPHYSTSLDAVWLLWPKLQSADYKVLCKFVCAWDEDDEMLNDWRLYNPDTNFLALGNMTDVTPERVCIAMLRAFGHEVL